MIRLGPDECRDLATSASREWLETNGIGGYASGTVAGLHTRRYHGLLVAATRPPLGRMVLLSKFEEKLIVDGCGVRSLRQPLSRHDRSAGLPISTSNFASIRSRYGPTRSRASDSKSRSSCPTAKTRPFSDGGCLTRPSSLILIPRIASLDRIARLSSFAARDSETRTSHFDVDDPTIRYQLLDDSPPIYFAPQRMRHRGDLPLVSRILNTRSSRNADLIFTRTFFSRFA